MTALGFSTAASALQRANNIVSPLRRVRAFLEDPMVIGFWGGGLRISSGARSWPAKPRARLSTRARRRGYQLSLKQSGRRLACGDNQSANARITGGQDRGADILAHLQTVAGQGRHRIAGNCLILRHGLLLLLDPLGGFTIRSRNGRERSGVGSFVGGTEGAFARGVPEVCAT